MKIRSCSMAIILIFLVTLPCVSHAFAQATTTVTSEVDDFDQDGYPDIKFTATSPSGPQMGVTIELTPEGSPGPLYTGSTDGSGILLLEDVPADRYTWVSSNGDSGTLTIDPSDYPLAISDEVAFWLWFLAFKSEAPSGEKGKAFLTELAKYVGYSTAIHPLPSKGSNDYENAQNYMGWIQGLEGYIDQNLATQPHKWEAAKTAVELVDQFVELSSEFQPATTTIQITIAEYIIVTPQGDVSGTIIEVEGQRVFDIRGASFSALGIFFGIFDLAVVQPKVIAEMRPDELVQHWFEIELEIYQDFLGIAAGMFGIAKVTFAKLGIAELSNTAAEFASALGAAIGIISIWTAILDYVSKYPDSPFWEHFNDWQVWQDMLLVVGGGLIAIGSVIAFLSYAGVLSVGAGAAITGVGIAVTVVALVIALGMWIYNWWNYNNQIQELRSQLSGALTNIFRTRESLNSVDIDQLQKASDESSKFATYALNYATEATGEQQASLQTAHYYLVALSQAQLNLRSAIIDARPALNNLIRLYLDYSWPSDPSKKIVAHLSGVNCTKANYVTSSTSFQVNASISYYHPEWYLGGYYYDTKYVDSEDLDGISGTTNQIAFWETDIGHPLGHWVGWAFEPPVEQDNEGHEFAVTYKITDSGNDFLVDNDPDGYDHSSSWKALTDSGTFVLYKFFFDQKDDDALNPWLNAIQGNALSNAREKLEAVQKAANSLRMATLPPKQREYTEAVVVDSYSLISASAQGDSRAFHIFTSPVGFLTATEGETFLIMSTGIAANTPGSPEHFESTDFGPTGQAGDTASLTLKYLVPSGATTLSFDFRFMSEEYPEFVGSIYNDFFYAYLTDSTGTHQVAFDDNGRIINVNSNFFNPNIYPIGTVFDGATKRLTTTVNVNAGETITLQFVVGDAGDGIYDTAVFLDNVRFNVGGGGPGTTPTADVIVVKNGPNSVEQGKQFTYTINYFDIEEAAAQNVVVIDNLPSQVTFVSASAGGIYSSTTNSVTWDLGTLQPFSSGSLTLTVSVPSTVSIGTVLQDSASITTTSQESNSNNNQQTKITTVTAGTSFPANVEVGPTVSNYNGIPVLYWTTPITFTYHGDATVTGVDINIHLPDGGPDIGGPMTNTLGTYNWIFTYIFYPRHGQGTVTYTVHYSDGHQSTTTHSILVDPSGYIYNAITGQRIQGVTVTLYRFDTVLQQFALIAPSDSGIEPHTNPQITDENGGYGWMVSPGMYMVKAEKTGYTTNFAIVTIPPSTTDLNIPLTPIDANPPTTKILIEGPHYIDAIGNTYVTSTTSFTLIADDGPEGSGVAATYYRQYNTTQNSNWKEQPNPFYVTGLEDGNYSIDYYSADVAGNVEPTNTQNITLDNTSPATILTIGKPQYFSGVTYVTIDTSFTLKATDTGSGVKSTAYRIYNAIGYDGGWRAYVGSFNFSSLNDGTYTIAYNSTDNVGNVGPSNTVNVTLVRAKWLKQDALSQLNSLLPTGNKGVDAIIIDVSGKIKQCLAATLWVDENHPNTKYCIKIFDSEKAAVQELMTIINGKAVTQTVKNKITAVIDKLVKADKEIALVAICEAEAKGSTDPRVIHEIKEAHKEYNQALTAIANRNYGSAVEEFKHAWMRAQHAMKKQFGDVNTDGKVNLSDCITVANAFGSYPGKPKWNPMADLNGDNKVDLKDYIIVTTNFGKVYN